jgi:small subunit ribosomal protein S5
VRRVARVVAGGRRFSFAVGVVIGDRKGRVGVGTGKAGDVASAMEKAAKDAKKHMVTVKLSKSNSIPHLVVAKRSSAIVQIAPAPQRGLVAGTAVRNVLEFAGITDVNAKVLSGSKNRLNIARAAVAALGSIRARAGVRVDREETPVSSKTETVEAKA